MTGVRTAVVAAGSLVAGFGVAQVTGVRWLGGLVLVVALVGCVGAWAARRGAGRAALLAVVYVGAFVGSHVLAQVLPAWPSVVLAAAAVGVASLMLG